MPNSKIIRTTPETQGDSSWIPPSGTLGQLAAEAWNRSQLLSGPIDYDAIASSRAGVPALSSVLRGSSVAIIAEIKRSSPSRGAINPELDSALQAQAYANGGAAAISVLTEPHRFGGSEDDLAQVRASVALPLLKKDFHVTEAQIAHAARLGASAALVIVRAIEPSRLELLAETARLSAIELVFEVRTEAELSEALDAGAMIIGVNNRNLETLEIDAGTVNRIAPMIPSSCIAIAESGYSDRRSIENAAAAGADAVLIGSFVSAAANPAQAVRELTSVVRHPRKD